MQNLINNKWVADNKNDYGRSERQRDFLILAMDRAVDKGGRNPSTMRNLLDIAIESNSMILDEKLTPKDLIDIGRAFSASTSGPSICSGTRSKRPVTATTTRRCMC